MTINNIIELAEKYNNTDRNTIKSNISHYIRITKTDRNKLAESVGITRNTLNSYTKKIGNVPDFVTALKLTEQLNIKINDLMEG